VPIASRDAISACGLRHDGRRRHAAHRRAEHQLSGRRAEHQLSGRRAEHLLSVHRGVPSAPIALGSRAFGLMTAFADSKTPDCAAASWRAPKSFLRCGLSVAF
jgi:hypothetical protein